jgi:hypothetical protein
VQPQPEVAAGTAAELTQAQRIVAIGGWWLWWIAIVGFFLKPPHPLARRHAVWAVAWGLLLSVVFGFFPLLVLLIAGATGNRTFASVATLGGLGWNLLGFLVWLAAAGVNTYAVLQGKGPWLRPVEA